VFQVSQYLSQQGLLLPPGRAGTFAAGLPLPETARGAPL
jgi:hypothetical protein